MLDVGDLRGRAGLPKQLGIQVFFFFFFGVFGGREATYGLERLRSVLKVAEWAYRDFGNTTYSFMMRPFMGSKG